MCSIRITSFMSNISGKSILKVIQQIVEGETNPDILVESIHIRIVNKHKKEVFKLALTGISQISTMIVISEIGADMKAFENSNEFSGWTRLRPINDKSTGKYKSTATTKGNRYLKAILVQIVWSVCRTKGSTFKEKFNNFATRKSKKKALIAIARKISVLICSVLYYKQDYNPLKVIVYSNSKLKTKINYHQKELNCLELLNKQ